MNNDVASLLNALYVVIVIATRHRQSKGIPLIVMFTSLLTDRPHFDEISEIQSRISSVVQAQKAKTTSPPIQRNTFYQYGCLKHLEIS